MEKRRINNYDGCSFDGIKPEAAASSPQCFSPSFLYRTPEWAATLFLIQFGFMFSCFLRSRGRGEGNNIYATAG